MILIRKLYDLILIVLFICPLAKESFTQENNPDEPKAEITARDYLKDILYTRNEIDHWLDGTAFPFAYYHSEFGWLLNNAQFQDGVDNSVSIYTYAENDGERLSFNYSEKSCRINTYGNSFTMCHQVSDHETWQEVLAAHIQEPIRNFGIGGWSAYQAYLRMLKEESDTPAECIIFNIYQDDHRRNLDSWRNIRRRKHSMFIEPTLPYLKVDLGKKHVIECPNPCPTKNSLYALSNLNKTDSLFKEDFVLAIMLAHANSETKNPYKSYFDIMELTKTHGIETQIEDNETLAQAAEAIHIEASLFSSRWLINQIETYISGQNKKVLYVLSYPASAVAKYIEEGERWDQPFVDYLKDNKINFIDLAEEHKKDYEKYKIGTKEYLNQYYIGHYNPRGNFFCAFSIKNKLIEMLDPKPMPYK